MPIVVLFAGLFFIIATSTEPWDDKWERIKDAFSHPAVLTVIILIIAVAVIFDLIEYLKKKKNKNNQS